MNNSVIKPARPKPIIWPFGSPGPRTKGAKSIDPQIAPAIVGKINVVRFDLVLEFASRALRSIGKDTPRGAYGLSLVSRATMQVPTNGNHHRVAAKKVSKVERRRSATSVHGFVMSHFLGIQAVFRVRGCTLYSAPETQDRVPYIAGSAVQ